MSVEEQIFNRKPRAHMKILRALTLEFQPLEKMAFESGDTLGCVLKFLKELAEMGLVEKKTVRSCERGYSREYNLFRWTRKGLEYFEIQKQRYVECCRQQHTKHRTVENEGHSCSS